MACFLIMPSAQRIARTGQFQVTVAAIEDLSPRMRRITLASSELAEHDWPLACDIAVVLAGEDGREVRRRYTVRSTSEVSLVVDAVLHGHGPGSTWAAGLTVGDEITFFGPRGEVPVADADWLLALTDEAGLPAIAALAEAVSPRLLTVYAEVADGEDRYPFGANVDVHWLSRGDIDEGGTALLSGAIDSFQPPKGHGYAYVLGESRAIVSLRDQLASIGLSRNDVYAKGYWNLQSRPTR